MPPEGNFCAQPLHVSLTAAKGDCGRLACSAAKAAACGAVRSFGPAVLKEGCAKSPASSKACRAFCILQAPKASAKASAFLRQRPLKSAAARIPSWGPAAACGRVLCAPIKRLLSQRPIRCVDVRKHWFWAGNFGVWRIQKPRQSSRIAGVFHAAVHAKLPGQNCFAPLKQKLGLQSREKCRRPPLWPSRHFDGAVRPNSRFRGSVFLRRRAFGRGLSPAAQRAGPLCRTPRNASAQHPAV